MIVYVSIYGLYINTCVRCEYLYMCVYINTYDTIHEYIWVYINKYDSLCKYTQSTDLVQEAHVILLITAGSFTISPDGTLNT